MCNRYSCSSICTQSCVCRQVLLSRLQSCSVKQKYTGEWYHFIIPPANVYRNHSVCLSVRPSVQSKLNPDRNFFTKGDRALLLHKCIPCHKSFLLIPNFLILWPWPWLLTYFWKNLTLAITFEPKVIGLSYFTFVFLVARHFCKYQYFWICDLDLDLLLKNLTLAITFEPKAIGLSHFTCVFLVARPFCCKQFF